VLLPRQCGASFEKDNAQSTMCDMISLPSPSPP
jgi:hypothetical protein